MLQNRVDPCGNIIKTKARGSWIGNRGVIHNNKQEIICSYKLNAWITCLLEYRGRKRQVMAPGRWTELFFLDEATSFAAGHRPCFECRRSDADKFKSLWLQGNPEYQFDEKTSIKKIDEILQKERINENKSKVTYEESINNIPNGSFVLIDDKPFLVFGKRMYLWSPFGYERGMDLPKIGKLFVVTPKSVVNAFRAGYMPQVALAEF